MAHRKRDPHTASEGNLMKRMKIPSLSKIGKEMNKITPLSKASFHTSTEVFPRVVGQPLKVNTKRATAKQQAFSLGRGPESFPLLHVLTDEN